jgi:hypothetical protein
MKEIFLLVDKTYHNDLHDVIVLLVEYDGYYSISNKEIKLQFQSNELKDLGYFAQASNPHNKYRDVPVRLGALNISNMDLNLFTSQPGLKLKDILGEAVFTENSAELTSFSNVTLINSDDYVPIYAKAGIIMTMQVYTNEDSKEPLDERLSALLH